MKVLVLGAGGVGGYFGARLVESGADVTFLVRAARHDQLAHGGLRLESPFGSAQLAVKSIVAAELQPGYDLVLLACKSYGLEAAMDAISPAMNGECVVLPLLNGLAHFDRLDERFGRANVLGGTCTLSVRLREDGVVHHVNRLHRLAFGERGVAAPVSSWRAKALAEAFAKTPVDWELSASIEQELWEKIFTLSVLASVTCLFRATIGEIVRAPGGPIAIEAALATTASVAAREGFAPRPVSMDFARKLLLDPSSTLTASMLHDIERGAPVESDHIVGWMLDRAASHGIERGVLSLAYTQIKAYEARRCAASRQAEPRCSPHS